MSVNSEQTAKKTARLRLSVESISKKFGGATAVTDVSITLKRGAILGLIGPNGSGKTTLINLINGLIRADSGIVRLDGIQIDNLPPSRRAGLGVARTFQVPRVFPSLTVRQNICVPLLHNNVLSRKAAGQRLDALLDLTALHDDADRAAGLISGGQQKLLEFARALISVPDLVLMDEPFAGVHPSIIEIMSQGIRSLAAQNGCTFIIASHEVPELLTVADTMMAMMAGRTLALGAPQEVVRDERVLESYLGSD
jgi:ABC-type branched-subunit amino acid transport system ATPase component